MYRCCRFLDFCICFVLKWELLFTKVRGIRKFYIIPRPFFGVHNKKKIAEDKAGIDFIIYGHSHKYEEKNRNVNSF